MIRRSAASAGSLPLVIDVGCGEGTLLGMVMAGRSARLCGVDLSARAISRAARTVPPAGLGIPTAPPAARSPGVAVPPTTLAVPTAASAETARVWIVANADRGLPFLDGSADLVLSLFGRCNAPEIARVLRPGGRLLAAVPGDDDLIELREAVQGEGRRRDRVPELLAALGVAAPRPSPRSADPPRSSGPPANPSASRFALRARRTWRTHAAHDGQALSDLLSMTYRGQRRSEQGRLQRLERLDVTLSAELLLLAAL